MFELKIIPLIKNKNVLTWAKMNCSLTSVSVCVHYNLYLLTSTCIFIFTCLYMCMFTYLYVFTYLYWLTCLCVYAVQLSGFHLFHLLTLRAAIPSQFCHISTSFPIYLCLVSMVNLEVRGHLTSPYTYIESLTTQGLSLCVHTQNLNLYLHQSWISVYAKVDFVEVSEGEIS